MITITLPLLSSRSITNSLTVEVLNYLDAVAKDEALAIKKAIRNKIKFLLEKARIA